MARIALSIGSNLGNRLINLREAVRRLNLLLDSETMFHGQIVAKSAVYETEPWGVTDQPAFLNACLLLDLNLNLADFEALLAAVKNIEHEMGRVEHIRWGARNIDIDILLIDDLVYSSQSLQIPHVNLHERDFVLVPLLQILSDWSHPILGLNVQEMKNRLVMDKPPVYITEL